MKRYRYAEVRFSAYFVGVSSTDSLTVEWLLAELKKLFPDFQFVWQTLDFEGKLCACNIKNLHGKDVSVGMWMLQQLGLNGWEVFQVGPEQGCFQLRLEEET
ncbi:MAG: hypothetical protein FJ014_18530 [Chloroflexi bacterium]|nr:hypothetical protein [Chloroflexota bacterium]